MTPLQREALQMCLEYIETDAHERRHVRWKINEALAEQPATEESSAAQPAAQPQQEPVVLPCCGFADASAIKWNPYNQAVQCHNCGQVYAAPQPPQRKPLTDEQLHDLLPTVQLKDEKPVPMVWLTRKDAYEYARAIEAVHGITGEQK